MNYDMFTKPELHEAWQQERWGTEHPWLERLHKAKAIVNSIRRKVSDATYSITSRLPQKKY